MNIFATSPSAYASAQALDDKRVIKMIAETTQMLCTAARKLELGHRFLSDSAPKSTHPNHPCTRWVGETSGNFRWTLEHLSELHSEKKRRWPSNAPHAWRPVFDQLCEVLVAMEAEGGKRKTPFVNCARNSALGLDFTHVQPTTDAYRRYLIRRWLDSQPRWTRRGPPEWAASVASEEAKT